MLKMLATAIPKVGQFFASHSWVSLVVIVIILMLSILFSVLMNEKEATLVRQRVDKEKH